MTEHGMVLAFGGQEASQWHNHRQTQLTCLLYCIIFIFPVVLISNWMKMIISLLGGHSVAVSVFASDVSSPFHMLYGAPAVITRHQSVRRCKRTLLFLTAYSLLNIKYLCQNEFMLQLLNRIDDWSADYWLWITHMYTRFIYGRHILIGAFCEHNINSCIYSNPLIHHCGDLMLSSDNLIMRKTSVTHRTTSFHTLNWR